MPLPPLMIALVLAVAASQEATPGPLSAAGFQEMGGRLLGLLGGLALLALVAGQWARRRVVQARGPVQAHRRLWRTQTAMELLNLGAFAYALFALEWPRIVGWNLQARFSQVLDLALNLAPYLLGQLTVWAGLVPAERVFWGIVHPEHPPRRGRVVLVNRFRMAVGLVLPGVFAFTLGADLIDWLFPSLRELPYSDLIGMVGSALALLLIAPALLRIAFPTRSLPPGELRSRLESAARRLGFRCTDIRVWDTGGLQANAAVTGLSPWFRYVLLTDALIDNLEPAQVEAVFGHEVGHIMHRHLGFFALFIVGSVGALALVGQGLEGVWDWSWAYLPRSPLGLSADWGEGAMLVLGCGLAIAYLLLVFGFVSRRFERQADVFGCRAVSCGLGDCPPHDEGWHGPATARFPLPATLCPVSIHTFANALVRVAILNGVDPAAHSWRHGSIQRRVGFLADLEGRPDEERRFQRRVAWLRWVLGVGLLVATAASIWTGAMSQF